jgi:N-acetyl-alpha-D-muramate 1-phosphate uridylyltransferase
MSGLTQAMIFAAGIGARLRPYTDTCPKALVKVGGISLLQRNVEYLYSQGIRDIVVNIHHFPGLMREAIAAMHYEGLRIRISDETDALLETGGGLKKAAHLFADAPILVMNVDILTDLELSLMYRNHLSSGALATLAVLQRASSRGFLFDKNMRLCGWQNTGTGESRMAVELPETQLHLFAFSGIQIIDAALLGMIPFEGRFSMVDVYLALAAGHPVYGYDHSGTRWIDVGRPESLEEAERLFPGTA